MVVGERREYYSRNPIWKLVSACCASATQWVRTAHDEFQGAADELRPPARGAAKRHALIEQRIGGLAQLAQVGATLLESILQEKAVDALPIKTMGELARAAGRPDEPE